MGVIKSKSYNINKLWVMLTCAIRSHVKISKNRKYLLKKIKFQSFEK